ncbi:acyl-CoA dehydrogenase family protein [Massilia putida]|uniref:acyl-CoA dehydrogenase family protein n=1 Tax=Massilia putida TaxID=1141883 RepID=UPI00095177F1|nr:acyl-CoA dehydrogenase family protein [Massilia putida]
MAATDIVDSPAQPVFSVPRPHTAGIQARAAALLPLLRAQQRDNAARGHVSEVLHQQFVKAGFYRMLQPQRFGGLELDYLSFARAMQTIARGDPAVAAVLAQTVAQPALLASYWPESTQKDLFLGDGNIIAAHACSPAGSCVAVDGGYMVEGLWTDCAGVTHSTHFIGSSILRASDGQQYQARFVLDHGCYTVLHQNQRRGPSCSSVKVTRQFVLARRVVLFSHCTRIRYDEMPGLAVHPNPMYLATGTVLVEVAAVSPMIGAALAALDEYRAIVLSQRANIPEGKGPHDRRLLHGTFGRAVVLVDCAETLLERALHTYQEQCEDWQRSGTPTGTEASMRVWAMLDSAGRMAAEATEALYMDGGTAPVGGDRRMQRYLDDVHLQLEHHGHLQADLLIRIGRAQLNPSERTRAQQPDE